MKFINILIKDGNRTVSWEHRLDDTVKNVLDEHEFKPETESVMVNLKPVESLDCKLDCFESVVYKGIERLVITLKSVPEKRKVVSGDVR